MSEGLIDVGAVPVDIDALPGPRGWPLLGNLPEIDLKRFHQSLEGWARQYGSMFRVRLGGRSMVCLTDPALIREIQRQRPKRFSRGGLIEPVFEELGLAGVFSAEGERWKRQRRLWMQALNAHQIKGFLPLIDQITRRLLKRWTAAAERGDAVDVQSDLMRYTVDVTTCFAFGYDGNTLEQEGDVIQAHLHHVFPVLNRRLAAPFPYWRYFKLPVDRRLDRALAAVRAFVAQRIADARKRIAEQPLLAQQPSNLIEAFIVARDEDGSSLSDEEIFANTITALLAGEDTTANTLAWLLYFVCRDAEVQRRLQQTVDAALGEASTWTDVADVDRLEYIDALMDETLRLKPVAPFIGATALEDVDVGGHRFAAGTDFFLVLRDAALSEQEFTRPDAFQPQRWLDMAHARSAQRPPTPFGGGQRLCPGRSLAQTEVRSVVAMLARAFDMTLVDAGHPVVERFAFTMAPENLRVRFRPRR